MIKKYRLKKDLWFAPTGTEITYDPEWHEFTVNDETYNLRGSIGEGEITMLLYFIIDNKLTSIIEPIE